MRIKSKYPAQALAIVLVVLVVAVIIALALVSRSLSEQRQVIDERASSESIEIADTFLDSLTSVSYGALSGVAESTQIGAVCTNSLANYSFGRDGCTLDGLTEVENFLNAIDSQNPTYDADPYLQALRFGITEQCNSEESDGITVRMEPVGEDEAIEIEKDAVFGIVTGGIAPTQNTCQVNVTTSSIGSSAAGLVTTSIYATPAANERLSAIKEYAFTDIQGHCLGTSCPATPAFAGWGSWLTSANGTIPPIPYRKAEAGTTYNMYELRLRAIGADQRVRISSSPTNCMPRESMMKISATVNCNGNSRGKEFVVSDSEWAPEIFDYVILNGVGSLEHL